MEPFAEKPFDQFRKPTGETGKLVVEEMNKSHYDLTTWGLRQVDIGELDCVLDVGCGGGRTVERLSRLTPRGKVYGVDYSEDCVNWASNRNEALIESGRVVIKPANVENLPFKDGMFDKVFAVETIYFWQDFERSFQEIHRVLKGGGAFIIINEAYKCDRFKGQNEDLAKTGGMKILSPAEATALLERAGFQHVRVQTEEDKNWMCCMAEKPLSI